MGVVLFHSGEYDVMCGGSPLICLLRDSYDRFVVRFFMTGRFTGEESFIHSFSPLIGLITLVFFIVSMSGRLQGSYFIYSRSPLSEPDLTVSLWFLIFT